MKLGGRIHGFWLWWWELPGEHWWFPDPFFGRYATWSVNDRGPAAWPGMARCLFRPHSDDSYGNCVFCGKSLPSPSRT